MHQQFGFVFPKMILCNNFPSWWTEYILNGMSMLLISLCTEFSLNIIMFKCMPFNHLMFINVNVIYHVPRIFWVPILNRFPGIDITFSTRETLVWLFKEEFHFSGIFEGNPLQNITIWNHLFSSFGCKWINDSVAFG